MGNVLRGWMVWGTTMTDLRTMRLEALRQRRAEYIRDYKRGSIIPSRKDARMWALFFSALIRRLEQ